MHALILTLCMMNDGCQETAPGVFYTMADCETERAHLVASGQIGANAGKCEPLEFEASNGSAGDARIQF